MYQGVGEGGMHNPFVVGMNFVALFSGLGVAACSWQTCEMRREVRRAKELQGGILWITAAKGGGEGDYRGVGAIDEVLA